MKSTNQQPYQIQALDELTSSQLELAETIRDAVIRTVQYWEHPDETIDEDSPLSEGILASIASVLAEHEG